MNDVMKEGLGNKSSGRSRGASGSKAPRTNPYDVVLPRVQPWQHLQGLRLRPSLPPAVSFRAPG
jgi:hypothetical protein